MILVAIALATAPKPPSGYIVASGITGGDLHEYCSASSSPLSEICSYYVTGAADALATSGDVCMPVGRYTEQARAVVLRDLNNRPEDWHKGAFFLVRRSLMRSFPCK